jgi:hypothetical protein
MSDTYTVKKHIESMDQVLERILNILENLDSNHPIKYSKVTYKVMCSGKNKDKDKHIDELSLETKNAKNKRPLCIGKIQLMPTSSIKNKEAETLENELKDEIAKVLHKLYILQDVYNEMYRQLIKDEKYPNLEKYPTNYEDFWVSIESAEPEEFVEVKSLNPLNNLDLDADFDFNTKTMVTEVTEKFNTRLGICSQQSNSSTVAGTNNSTSQITILNVINAHRYSLGPQTPLDWLFELFKRLCDQFRTTRTMGFFQHNPQLQSLIDAQAPHNTSAPAATTDGNTP